MRTLPPCWRVFEDESPLRRCGSRCRSGTLRQGLHPLRGLAAPLVFRQVPAVFAVGTWCPRLPVIVSPPILVVEAIRYLLRTIFVFAVALARLFTLVFPLCVRQQFQPVGDCTSQVRSGRAFWTAPWSRTFPSDGHRRFQDYADSSPTQMPSGVPAVPEGISVQRLLYNKWKQSAKPDQKRGEHGGARRGAGR